MIAPSFADIFFNNSFKNGFLPIVLTELEVDHLFNEVAAHAGLQAHDRPAAADRARATPGGASAHALRHRCTRRKECLLNGWDEIGLTLRHADEIRAYEEKRKRSEPWIFS